MGITTKYLYDVYTNAEELGEPNTRIENIIEDVCDLIQQACNRTFETATYKEWVDGSQTNYLFLKNYPITKIKRVSQSSIDVMDINNSGNEYAAITSNGASIILNTIDDEGTEFETVLNYASNANVSSLATSINAVSTWTTSVISDYGSKLSSNIKPLWGENIYDNESIELTVPYQSISVRVSDNSNNAIETVNGCNFTGGHSNVFVHYVAGYVLPVDNDQHSELRVAGNVPSGLTLVANMICKDVIDAVEGDMNMKDETIGNYKYVRGFVLSAIRRHWEDLQEYALKVI